MTYHALSLGAGVNSTALLHIIADERLPLDEVIFADTGAEKPETYAYIERWILPFLAKRGILYVRVAARYKGEEDKLQARCIRGHTVPDRRYRWSTRDFKIRPIYRHLKPLAPVVCYLGIAYDEIHRMKDAQESWMTRAWPLIDRKITRAGCVAIIESKGWPVPPKSGCFFCPFASLAEWRWLHAEHPELWAEARRIEENGSKYPQFSLVRGTLARLEKRFDGERSQKTLEAFQDPVKEEECEGVCFT